MKKLLLISIALFTQQSLFAQGVGINTTNPHQSAALHINSNNKGVLLPNVSLTSETDNTTIPSAAFGLLLWNTNPSLPSGTGFYYNAPAAGESAHWRNLTKQFTIPYYSGLSTNATHFRIDNYSNSATSVAIQAYHGGPGTGISTFSSSGLALDVSGKVKIAGNGHSPGVGKVLTSDADGNATWEGAVAFRASGVKGGGSEKIAKFVNTKIAFATEEYDLGANYNDANVSPHSTFKAPSDGIYHFDVKVKWVVVPGQEDPTSLSMYLKMQRNGIVSIITDDDQRSLGGSLCRISSDVKLLKDDQIFVEVYHTNPDDYLDLYVQSTASYFNGRLIFKQ